MSVIEKFHKVLSAASIIAAVAVTAGCSGAPVQKAPPMKLAQTVMTNSVVKNAGSQTAAPGPETAVFSTKDEKAIAFVKLENISGAHSLKWEWYTPEGSLYYSSGTYPINKDEHLRDTNASWHAIAIKNDRAANMTGRWTVRVSLDGEQIAAKNFEIINQAPKVVNVNIDGLVSNTPLMAPDRRKWALIVGIEKYKKTLPVPYAVSDARLMQKYFVNHLGVPEENALLLLNENATKSDIDVLVKDKLLGLLTPQDTLYVYYAGHGIPADEAPYLLPYDGDAESPVITGYPVETLYKDLDKLPAKEVYVFLDTCFSGKSGRADEEKMLLAGARPGVLKVKDPVLLSDKLVVLAAAKTTQLSNFYKDKEHGIFTYYLIKGLLGDADRNGDSKIKVLELSNYLSEEVAITSRRLFGLNRQQNPQVAPWPLGAREDAILTIVAPKK